LKGNLAVAALLLLVSLGCLTTGVCTQANEHGYPNQATSTTVTSFVSGTNVTGRGLGWISEPSKPTITATRTQTYPYLPQRFDWTDYQGYNWMTPVRNQGGCGSCVAFATVGAVEALYRISYNRPDWNIDLSEQHLFSCGGRQCLPGSAAYGWWFGDGGSMNYMKDFGTPDEGCDPYAGRDQSCSISCPDWQSRAYKIYSWAWVNSAVPEIEAALMSGPVLAAFTVHNDFFSYKTGIYHWDHTSSIAGGHAVVIVGYDNVNHYWKAKNSWGSSWGENGYFKIGFGECGIEEDVVSASLGLTPITVTMTTTTTATYTATSTTTRTATWTTYSPTVFQYAAWSTATVTVTSTVSWYGPPTPLIGSALLSTGSLWSSYLMLPGFFLWVGSRRLVQRCYRGRSKHND
jgi:C1A family cysteine protease